MLNLVERGMVRCTCVGKYDVTEGTRGPKIDVKNVIASMSRTFRVFLIKTDFLTSKNANAQEERPILILSGPTKISGAVIT